MAEMMKIAALDIGTNSIHMVHMAVAADHTVEIVEREKKAVRLGLGLFSSGKLTDRAFHEGVETVRRYAKLAEQAGVDVILAVATSATRDASNGKQFLRQIEDKCGLQPRVITGTEEARLIFRAVCGALPIEKDTVLVLDIGGGSAEIAVGNGSTVRLTESLRLGVQRLLERLGHPGPLSKKELKTLRQEIREAAANTLTQAKQMGVKKVIGTSGTIETLGEAAHLFAGHEAFRQVNSQVVSLKDLKKFSKALVEATVEGRLKFAGIDDFRSENIHLGSLVVIECLKLLELDEITLCDASLREGVVYDYLDRRGTNNALPNDLGVRRRSVLSLARRYEREDPYDHQVTRLALQIFDETASLHRLDSTSRELLEYASLLHGIGKFIAFRRRHKHTAYLVEHARLRGFAEEEVLLLANVARYHRRALPKKKHAPYKALSKTARGQVRVLSAILRLAIGLDRGQLQVVKDLICEERDGVIQMVLSTSGDCELEIWACRERKLPLQEELGKKISVKARRNSTPPA